MCKNRWIFLAVVLILFLLGFLLIKRPDPIKNNILSPKSQDTQMKSIMISDLKIYVEIAESSEEKAKGLSGRTSLPEDQGMLFVFANKTYPSFWMIDMKIPLDIIWISDDTVIHIDENAPPQQPGQPDSNLPLYKPAEAVNYVLEVNAGFVAKNGIKVGDKVNIRYQST